MSKKKDTTIELKHGLPSLYVDRLYSIYSSKQANNILEHHHPPQKASFFINTTITTIDSCLKQLTHFTLEPHAYFKHVFIIPISELPLLSHHPLVSSGHIYIQELSSMYCSEVLQPQANEEILDTCAAPGGKSIHNALYMNNHGRIAAVEVVKDRFFKMKQLVKTYHATIIDTYLADSRFLWKKVPNRFHRVLVDAPCSSESRFISNTPKTFQYWSKKKINDLSRKQYQILLSAVQCCKPQGTILYSTCTHAPEENEMIINKILKRSEIPLEILPIHITTKQYVPGISQWDSKKLHADLNKAIRLLPQPGARSLFMCLLKRKA